MTTRQIGPTLAMLSDVGEIASAVQHAMRTDAATDILPALRAFASNLADYCNDIRVDPATIRRHQGGQSFDTLEFGVKELAKEVSNLTLWQGPSLSRVCAVFLEFVEKSGYGVEEVIAENLQNRDSTSGKKTAFATT